MLIQEESRPGCEMAGSWRMVSKFCRQWYFQRTIQTIQTSPKASSLSSPNVASINHRCVGNANLDVTWVQLPVATSGFWNASLIFKHRNPLFKRLLKVQVTFAFSFQNFTVNLILLSSSGEKPRNIFETTVMEPSRHSKRTCHSPYSQFNCLPSVYGSIACIGG